MSKKYKGSNFKKVGNITIGAITPEARDLLDEIMEAWEKQYADIKKNMPEHEPSYYGFAYWLVRWSGLIEPAKHA